MGAGSYIRWLVVSGKLMSARLEETFGLACWALAVRLVGE